MSSPKGCQELITLPKPDVPKSNFDCTTYHARTVYSICVPEYSKPPLYVLSFKCTSQKTFSMVKIGMIAKFVLPYFIIYYEYLVKISATVYLVLLTASPC